MGIIQGLSGVGVLFGGAIMLVSAVIQLANSSISSELGFGLATSGVIGIILGAILLQTND